MSVFLKVRDLGDRTRSRVLGFAHVWGEGFRGLGVRTSLGV